MAGLYGLQGWVKIVSYTEPRENILEYQPWFIKSPASGATQWSQLTGFVGRLHNKGIVAQLDGESDPSRANRWKDAQIGMLREQLPPLAAGDYYWSDLLGFKVINLQAVELGLIDHFISTGANDVMVLAGQGERLIPFVKDKIVHHIDLTAKVMRVDWDAEF